MGEGEMSAGKTMFWVAIILGVIIAGGIIFVQKFQDSEFTTTDISRDALLVGAELSMEQGDKFVVDFVDGKHEFVLEEILNSKVRLREGLVYHVLLGNENLSLDFNKDGVKDVVISLTEMVAKESASFSISSPEVDCVEVWECSDWSQCIDGSKKRVCVDQSICGTDVNRPAFSESC